MRKKSTPGTLLYMNEVEQLIRYAEQQQLQEPALRMGQLLYNLLYQSHPTLAKGICGSEADPFYFDDNINRFLRAITLQTT